MKKYKLNDKDYELVKDEFKVFNYEMIDELIKDTDYFGDFDYIFGDYAYDKLRLKGFNDKSNQNFNKINDIATMDDYILNFCAYGAKWFLLKKVK